MGEEYGDDDVESEDEKYNPGETVDISRTIETPEVSFVYGRTPEEIKQKYFMEICQNMGLTKEDLAKTVMEKSWLEKLEMIRQLHSSDKQALEILDICKQEYKHLSRVQTQHRLSLPESEMTIVSAKTEVDKTEESHKFTSVASVDAAQSSSPSQKKNYSPPISNPENHIHPCQRPLKPAPE